MDVQNSDTGNKQAYRNEDGYVDSHIIDQALRLRLKDETSVILSDLYLQILQYIEMNNTTLTDIIINDRESVLS
ncbi:hypothetical protein U4W44_21150 [Escherichia coli]|nr:hypothetical protein [Escherichia coli]